MHINDIIYINRGKKHYGSRYGKSNKSPSEYSGSTAISTSPPPDLLSLRVNKSDNTDLNSKEDEDKLRRNLKKSKSQRSKKSTKKKSVKKKKSKAKRAKTPEPHTPVGDDEY